MAEGRFLSKSIATSRKLKNVSLEADYLFARLIPHLDRDGRVDGDPDILKAIACPLRPEMTVEKIAGCLAELDAVEAIRWYEVSGQKVVWVSNFHDHQQGMRPERERPSKLPSQKSHDAKPAQLPTNSRQGPEDSRNVADEVRPREVKLREVKRREVKARNTTDSDSGESVTGVGGHTPDTPALPKPHSWPAEGAELWAAKVGPISVPRYGKAMKPVVDQHGWPTAKLGQGAYIELNEGRTRKLEWFVDDAVRWIRLGGMPMVDPATGNLTEAGMMAARQVKAG